MHTRQGVRSTKENTQVLQHSADGTTTNVYLQNYYDIYMKVTRMKNTIYTDQTGKLPVTSGGGRGGYLIITCEVYTNSILTCPMTTKTEKEMISTNQTLLYSLK